MMNEQRITMFLKAAITAIVLLLVSLLFIPDKYLFVKLFSEDGFYSLTVAKNIAEGNGVTIDGTMLTNGFQPLFTLVCVIPFLFAGDNLVLALQILYAIHLIIFFATAWVVGLCVRSSYAAPQKTEAFWTALFLYISSLYLFSHHTNALETGLLMMLYALLWRFLQTQYDDSNRSSVLPGVAFGILVLARIDAGFFCASFALVYIWKERRRNISSAVRAMTITAAVALVVSSPWWMYNMEVFGSVMPTSGIAEQKIGISFQRMVDALSALIQNLVPYLHAGRYDNVLFASLRMVLLLLGLAIVTKHRQEELVKNSNFFIPLIAAIAALAVWYSTTSYATYFYGRYLLPITLLSVFLTLKILSNMNSAILKSVLLAAAAMPLLAFLIIAYTAQSYTSLEEFYRATNPMYRLVQKEVPSGEMIGSGQSGFLGFMRKDIVNLDGKVNAEVLAYKDSIWKYLDAREIQWFCDDSVSMDRYAFYTPRKYGWELHSAEGHFYLYKKLHE